MTEEQIKQNAEKYTDSMRLSTENPPSDFHIGIYHGYIAGAHSRDEEVKQWKESKRKLRLRLMQRIHDLRNPWISVDDRLPEEEGDYLIQVDSFSRATFGFYSVRNNKFLHLPPNVNVTHWMPIPELKKGE